MSIDNNAHKIIQIYSNYGKYKLGLLYIEHNINMAIICIDTMLSVNNDIYYTDYYYYYDAEYLQILYHNKFKYEKINKKIIKLINLIKVKNDQKCNKSVINKVIFVEKDFRINNFDFTKNLCYKKCNIFYNYVDEIIRLSNYISNYVLLPRYKYVILNLYDTLIKKNMAFYYNLLFMLYDNGTNII